MMSSKYRPEFTNALFNFTDLPQPVNVTGLYLVAQLTVALLFLQRPCKEERCICCKCVLVFVCM